MQLIEQTLSDKADQFISDIQTTQRQIGIRASGRSAASLRKAVTRSGQTSTLQLLGAAYFYQQMHGRKPSSKKPSRAMVESLREWVKIRGLNIPAYAIAMKIQREGITVPNRFNPGGVLDAIKPETVRGQLKTALRPVLKIEAKSILFS